MGWLTKLGMRLRALRHGDEVHREIAEEWQFHIVLRTEENIRRGVTPEEARQNAEQHSGNRAYIVSWDVRGGGLVETLWQAKTPGPVAKANAASVVLMGFSSSMIAQNKVRLLRRCRQSARAIAHTIYLCAAKASSRSGKTAPNQAACVV